MFLLIIFGETPYGIALLSILVGVLLVCQFGAPERKQATTIPARVAGGTTLFSVIIAIAWLSLLVTQSVPLTLNRAMMLLASWVLFIWLLRWQHRWQLPELLGMGAIFISGALLLLSLAVNLMPQLNTHLPSMNLLIANYGHNHAAIWYLIALPLTLVWWQRMRRPWWGLLVAGAFLAGIIGSFGRVMIAEAFGVLLGMGWLMSRKALPKTLLFLLVPVVVALGIAGYLSFFLPSTAYGECNLPFLKVQLCKPIAHESRVHYWSQAVQAMRSAPWFGSGGGTFGQLSRQLSAFSYQYSAYTHNEYLQFAVEYGLLAGAVFLLFWILVAKRSLELLRSAWQHHRAVGWQEGWAIVALVLVGDALLDYNWQFAAVWLALVIATAFVLGAKEEEENIPRWWRWGWPIASSVVLVWGGLYVASAIVWRQGNAEAAQQLFPLVYWKVEETIGTPQLSPATSAFLTTLYWSHDTVLAKSLQHRYGETYFFVERTPDLASWEQLKKDSQARTVFERLVELAPMNEPYRIGLFRVTYAQHDWTALERQLTDMVERFSGDRRWLLSQSAREKMSGAAEFIASELARGGDTAAVERMRLLSQDIKK